MTDVARRVCSDIGGPAYYDNLLASSPPDVTPSFLSGLVPIVSKVAPLTPQERNSNVEHFAKGSSTANFHVMAGRLHVRSR